jgi:DNA uptake protein ComE-like DNA-binding protein
MNSINHLAAHLGAALLLTVTGACSGGGDNADTTQIGASATAGATTAAQPTTAVPTTVFLSPDSASREQLMAIPGIDSAIAGVLVAARPFQDMVAVDKILAKRLNETQRDSVYTRLWKKIDLNKASGEEIMLIPGVGARMRHEFEEYRPYDNIERFRREIGKYVDQNEVARLERYVEIRR